MKSVDVDGMEVRVNFWDLSGHPEFFQVRNEFYKETQGALLVFDVSSRRSFVRNFPLVLCFFFLYLVASVAQENLQKWLDEAEKFGCDPRQVVFVVVANKADKKRRLVPESEARAWAHLHGFDYFETSANTGQNVFHMFESVFKKVVHRIV